MKATSVLAVVVAVLLGLALVGATLGISRTIERFEDAQQSTSKEQELKTLIESITKRICPIQQEVIRSMAKNKAEKTTTEPTEEERKDATIQFMKGAGWTIFQCPANLNVYTLDSASQKDITVSAAYLYVKLVQVNKNMRQTLRGEPPMDIPYDPWANLDPTRRRVMDALLPVILKRYEEQQTKKPLEMNPAEKEAFLDQRLNEFKALLDRKDDSGEPELEALLTSVEREYKELQETKRKAQEGTLVPEIPEVIP